jgi:hypothetical protein
MSIPTRDIGLERMPSEDIALAVYAREAVATFGALVALATNISEDVAMKNTIVVVLFFLFMLLKPVYFWMRSRNLKKSDQPRWYFYPLSILAFAVWSIAASDIVRGALDVSTGLSEFALALGTFFIPFIDEALTMVQDAKPWRRLFRKPRSAA